jgi:DtxR family Mn-dependent transcriptional regulator
MPKATLEDLSPQMQDYLETITHLQEEARVARAKDIAQRLGVSRATVTSALRVLREHGLINYQPYSHITLTKSGEALAQEVVHRHQTLTHFLGEVLQMPRAEAEENACRAEHVLSPKVIERMVCFLEFLKRCPRTGEVWRQAFDRFCLDGGEKALCKECVAKCLAGLYAGGK